MMNDEEREQIVQNVSDLLRNNHFTFDVVVRKKPKGIKVIYEVTEEEMRAMIECQIKNRK